MQHQCGSDGETGDVLHDSRRRKVGGGEQHGVHAFIQLSESCGHQGLHAFLARGRWSLTPSVRIPSAYDAD